RIDAKETDQRIRMRGDVVGDVSIIDPGSTQPGFAAKNDGDRVVGAGGAIIFVANSEIDFDARASAPRLAGEILAEISRVSPGVAMDINDHDSFPRASTVIFCSEPSASRHQIASCKFTQGQT